MRNNTAGPFDDDLREALAAAQIGFGRLDVDGHLELATSTYLTMLGWRETDLIGESWRRTVHPDDHRRAEDAYRAARRDGRAYVELRGLCKDGTALYQALTITRRRGAQSQFVGFYCLRHDISGYKRDHETLLLAVESAPNGLLIANSEGHIRMANAAVENLFGYSRRELLNRPIDTLLPPRFHRWHRDAFDPTAGKETQVRRDLRGLRKDGEEIPVQVYLNTIEVPAGKLILYTIIDIAERVRQQEQLERATHAAEAANRAKSDFLARMSHEIRTPMNLINGMDELLLESELSVKQREYVEISHRNVRRLLRLIDGILDLSKVEAGKLTLEIAPFNIGQVLAECESTISAALEQKGLEFHMDAAPGVWPFLIGDAERLQQILLNLIGNAIKFTAAGRIDLRVRAVGTSEPPAAAAARNPALAPDQPQRLQFEVSDTGCGIPADKKSMIFEAFQQAEGSMDRKYEGTGLGLAIAKTLVEMMSGEIHVAEKEGPGATLVFTAVFPRTTEKSVRRRAPENRISDAKGKLKAGTRILVAEDYPENVVLLQAYLHGLPVMVEFAADGVEAVQKRCAGEFDLVLMDIQMPNMDGYAATRAIRAWEKRNREPRVPIVALTAHALMGAAQQSLEAGCDAHLSKPVERDRLIEFIARFAANVTPPAANPRTAPHAASPPPAPTVEESIQELQPRYLANRRRDLLALQQALASSDFETIQTIGHNCKGTAKGYGFPEISVTSAALEQAARARDAKGLEASITEFERLVRAGESAPRKSSK